MLRALVLLVLALVVAGAVTIWYIQRNGFSARAKPGPIETAVALRLRSFTIPSAGMEHFADHCAVCHANDGSGSTEIGGGLYPKPPDLKQERTQSLTDGELFHIIQNGVRFTGMPAFAGDDEEKDEKPADKEGHGEQDSWRLVLFVRHLPKITPAELTAMKKLNPKAPDEMAEQPGHAEPKRPAGPAHKHGRS
ncbi:MAG: cytochrome C [Acidobacteria bacterium]|nr:MAG: cytochrome C [Acidobacteriota bacterium]